MIVTDLKYGKPDISMSCNGMLAGLVAITAPCAFVAPWAAVIIGAIAGWLVVQSVAFFDRRGIDDPCGAISVHGMCGAWGVLSVGLFADGTYGVGWNGVGATSTHGVQGLLYGDPGQLGAQMFHVVIGFIWAWGIAWLLFTVAKQFMQIRVSPEAEIAGLDVPEFGALAYPDFVLHHSTPGHVTEGADDVPATTPSKGGVDIT
jgi:ammonium transporter, Amt family